MNFLKWGSHTAKECNAPKAPKANLADDSSKSGKSGRQVTREERSEDEEEYDNDAYYTDDFVKKRQLNMNVAHYTTPADEDSVGDCKTHGSAYSSDIYKDSSDESETKSTGSSDDSSHPVIHSAYMMKYNIMLEVFEVVLRLRLVLV